MVPSCNAANVSRRSTAKLRESPWLAIFKPEQTTWRRPASICLLRYNKEYFLVFRLKMASNDRMDTVGEEEHDPIKLKSIKNNRTFTVPQNDRVRHFFPTKIKPASEKISLALNSFNSFFSVFSIDRKAKAKPHSYNNECNQCKMQREKNKSMILIIIRGEQQ